MAVSYKKLFHLLIEKNMTEIHSCSRKRVFPQILSRG